MGGGQRKGQMGTIARAIGKGIREPWYLGDHLIICEIHNDKLSVVLKFCVYPFQWNELEQRDLPPASAWLVGMV